MIHIGLYGLLGYETAYKLFRNHEAELKRRFSKWFLDGFIALQENCPDISEWIHNKEPLVYSAAVGKGGLFGALWKLCEDWEHLGAGGTGSLTGCLVDLLKVPVRQEVVEICELYEENPYEVSSRGCFLVGWDDAREGMDVHRTAALGKAAETSETSDTGRKELLSILGKSAMIGQLTNDGRRVVVCEDAVRFLTPPERQQKDIKMRYLHAER